MRSMYQERIEKIKDTLGNDVVVMGHHYQTDEIIRNADLSGDSLELARKIENAKAKYIVFCGVYFMAESAAILARDSQQVFTPMKSASCIMSQMAPVSLVSAVLEQLKKTGKKIIPLAYVNSSAEVKAVCGANDGAVCTSANAETMLAWCMKQGDGVLFVPDKNLAMNTATTLGISKDEQMLLDIRGGGSKIDLQAAQDCKLFIWPGCCATHNNRFKVEQIYKIRTERPEAKIVVHPECPPAVVSSADGAGSTSYIIKYVREAAPGSTIYVGTEINMVQRLAAQYEGDKTIIPLAISGCSNMAKTTEQSLATIMDALLDEQRREHDVVRVAPEIVQPARLALQRMLDACSKKV